MMLGILLVILAILAAIVVAAPFLRRGTAATDESAKGVDVYKDQLAEVERDLEQGAIGKEEADLARVEIERRILNAAHAKDGADKSLGINWHYRIVTSVAAIVVLGSVGIYGVVGHADRFYAQQARNASAPAAGTQSAQQDTGTEQQQQLAKVETMVKRLEARLAANPSDGDGWRMLGWSYYNLGSYDKSVDAYKKAVKLQKDNPVISALMGEAMVKQAGGVVTDEALAVFENVLALKPDDERALFFKGMAQEQKGNPQGAIDQWIALYETAPKDAEWASDLRDRIESVAQANNIEISTRLKKATETRTASAEQAKPEQRGPTPEDVKNAQNMSKDDQNAMVRGMVEGLAARLEGAPNDPKGWIMLMRSHLVLNEKDKAQEALDRATKALADSPETLKQVADAAKGMGLSVSNKIESSAAADNVDTNAHPEKSTEPKTAAAAEEAKPEQRGPTAEDVKNAQQMSKDDQNAMVRNMVTGLAARLEDTPDDPKGWIMLMRSHLVLNEKDKAQEALDRATKALADSPDSMKQVADAAKGMGLSVSNN